MNWLNLLQGLAARIKRRPPDFVVGGAADPYLLRWFVVPRNPVFNIYLHEFRRSDDDRALHDHPWWWCSILLGGEYTEVAALLADGGRSGVLLKSTFRAGSIRFHRPKFAHRLVIEPGTRCTTLFITGPRIRNWGFHCPRGWVPWQKFTADGDRGSVGAGCGEKS